MSARTAIAEVVAVAQQYERRGYPGDPATVYVVSLMGRPPATIRVHRETDRTYKAEGTPTFSMFRWLPAGGWAHVITIYADDVIDEEDAARLGYELTEGIVR